MEKLFDLLFDLKVLSALIVVTFVLLFSYVIKTNRTEAENPLSKENKDNKSGKKKETSNKQKRKVAETKWSKSKSGFSHPWLLSSLKGHTGNVLDMDFSQNGKYLVSCSDEELSNEELLNPQEDEVEIESIPSSSSSSTSESTSECTTSESSDSNKENSRPSSTEPKTRKGLSRRQKKNHRKRDDGSGSPVVKKEPKPIKEAKKVEMVQPTAKKKIKRPIATPVLEQYQKCKFSVEEFYNLLIEETLPVEQLYPLGFPQKIAPNTAKIYSAFRRKNTRANMQINPINNFNTTCSSNSSYQRICTRCNCGFFTTEKEYLTFEQCRYHSGKTVAKYEGKRVEQVWTCCGTHRNAPPCQSAELHVWNGLTEEEEFLDGFVETRPNPNKNIPDFANGVYAVDCEMCFTVRGLELCKVTLIGMDGKVIYDEFVRPESRVIDYNTMYSGLTQCQVESAKKTLKDVQKDLLNIIFDKTTLIGHGLENDLRALRIVHKRVVDTSLSFRHEKGFPFRHSLRYLASCVLKKDCDFPHDSYEDAAVSMELMLWKVRHRRRFFDHRQVVYHRPAFFFVPSYMTAAPVMVPVRAVV